MAATPYTAGAICFTMILGSASMQAQQNPAPPAGYQELVQLFSDWREFEDPPLLNGAPDYTPERFAKDHQIFQGLEKRLNKIKIGDWPTACQVDWHIVRAEMNGYDFNYRVLKPWVRDPAYYQTVWMDQSDVPAHEGPTNHATLEFWTYQFPISSDEENRLSKDLKVIPPLLKQARENLTGNARDLWIAGIENIKGQTRDLDRIAENIMSSNPQPELTAALKDAQKATVDFTGWLEKQAPDKTGPSGIGKENYTWYQQNVHLLPLTWEEEVQLLQRELDRAWSSLKLEEHRNRDLPPMKAANTPEEFARLTENGVQRFMNFLKEKEIMPIKPNMEPALREHMGEFVPEDKRNFFLIGMHYDPVPLYCHFIHWFDLAQIRDEPHESPIRRGPLLYNIFDSKNEGIATGVEEMFMHAGLYENSPRSREIVWIMIAQRAARGLGSLYAHANEMTMAEAGQVHVKWTPRGWMKREPHLLQFEQHLYLRQPGYGTCYITGKYLIERLLTEWSEQLEEKGKPFVMKDFFQIFNDAGNIPVELVRWEMTGNNDGLKTLQ
ncbi:MAG TPA: hypothetical protein QF697_02175 [Candidatus Marinimicrobia bacterium]|nr:hypothetical protein [Candidatus Neomarinimicrobiota bacterium]|tara:strand:+ start:5007 stop:6662 length:1656 start_codon:yes stop_codon:yes gene_type:complete